MAALLEADMRGAINASRTNNNPQQKPTIYNIIYTKQMLNVEQYSAAVS
jgi:hypothetical protein